MTRLRITIITSLILSAAGFLVATNLGLRLILAIGSHFTPVSLKYAALNGCLISREIHLTNVEITQQDRTFTIEHLQINRSARQIIASNVQGWAAFMPQSAALHLDQDAKLSQVQADLEFAPDIKIVKVQAKGTWQKQTLTFQGQFNYADAKWQIIQTNLVLADNLLSVQHDDQHLNWQLQIKRPELFLKSGKGALYANGTVDWDNEIPRITAAISANNFAFADNSVDHLQANIDMAKHFSIKAQAKSLKVGKQRVNNLSLNASGNKDQLRDAWSSENLVVKFDDYTVKGAVRYDLPDNTLMLAAKDKLYNANLDLNFKTQAIAGQLDAHTEDLGLIMQWIPQMTRLKGSAVAHATISGTIAKPLIAGEAHITDITATFPALGIKIKPMELHVKTESFSKFVLSGQGQMRRGSGDFTVNGYIEPFKPNMPNEIHWVGKHLEFINNESAQLIASNNLAFVYDPAKTQLNVTGDIEIESGHINFNPKQSNITKSKDVVFVNEPHRTKNAIVLNPNIYLRIIEGVRFSGLDMEASISGKLDISRRHDITYASGRISIKEGVYKLPGQTLHINHGRLLYPPGTLLANPVLDIKLLSAPASASAATNKDEGVEIQLHGTAQKPIFSESGLANNQDKALSQALLTGSGVLSKDILRDKLKLTEVGVITEDQNQIQFFENPTDPKSKHKQLVIGRPLSKRVHAQYLHSMDETRKRLRLKIALNDYWEIGLEGGNRGAGADLSFVIERD